MEKLEIILAGCKAGKRKYQKLLYEKYYDFALKIVFRYIYNYEEAAEVTNDGFVKFFGSLDKFIIEKEGNLAKMLGGWIKRIMVNASIDLLRKKMMLPEIGPLDVVVAQNNYFVYTLNSGSHNISGFTRMFLGKLASLGTMENLPPSCTGLATF